MRIIFFFILSINSLFVFNSNTYNSIYRSQIHDSTNLLSNFNIKDSNWILIGTVIRKEYVIKMFNDYGKKWDAPEYFIIKNLKYLNTLKSDLKGIKSKENGLTADIVLKLIHGNKVVWQGSIFLYSNYCKIQADNDYIVKSSSLSILTISNKITFDEYKKYAYNR